MTKLIATTFVLLSMLSLAAFAAPEPVAVEPDSQPGLVAAEPTALSGPATEVSFEDFFGVAEAQPGCEADVSASHGEIVLDLESLIPVEMQERESGTTIVELQQCCGGSLKNCDNWWNRNRCEACGGQQQGGFCTPRRSR